MKSISNSSKLITGSLAVAALLCLPAPSSAITRTFNVNSSLSSMTMAGGVAGLGFVPAPAGSFLDFWGGTMTADVTGGVINFAGFSSAVTGIANTVAPFQPLIGGPFTPAVENYGAFASGNVLGLGGFTTVNGAWRNLSLNIPTGTAQNGLTPGGMTLQYNAGSRLDFFVTSPASTGPGQSNLASNPAAGNTTVGLVAWDGVNLNLPVKFTMTGANGLVQVWQGNIVATMVPEPSSMALAMLGLGLVAARRSRNSSVLKS